MIIMCLRQNFSNNFFFTSNAEFMNVLFIEKPMALTFDIFNIQYDRHFSSYSFNQF
jgi:hypothetical protein